MTRIVLIGNCQIEAMLGFYRQFAAISRDQHITYIRSYEAIGDDDRRAIEAADIVVEQVQDFKPVADIGGAETRAERIGVPVVHGGFLWPFAGQPHPHNPTPPVRPSGPYGAETSDAWLNRQIKKGVAPDDAVAAYLALDVNAVVNLDRLLEISLEKQRMRDELCGFAVAGVIAGHFRDEPLFRTPYHPNVRVAVALATQFFDKLGVDAADARRMQRVTRIAPFPKDELPVHPAVARHFGLTWATEDRRYQFQEEGGFTFTEFARRYMVCAWNVALDEGLEATRTGDLPRALYRLTEAVAQSPEAAAGHAGLAYALDHLGRPHEALAAIRRALAIEPDRADRHLHHALLLDRVGESVAAEREMRIAAALDPFEPHYHAMLANRLSRDGAHDEAAAVARLGLVAAPRGADLHVELAGALEGLGDRDGAVAAYHRAASLAPEHDGARQALLRLGVALPDPVPAAEPAPAAPVGDRAAPLSPPEARLAAIEQRIAAGSVSPAIFIDLGDALLAMNQVPRAEAAYRAALAADPDSAHALGQLGYALSEQGRHDEAVAARLRATELDPDNPPRHVQLGHVLLRAGRHDEAVAAMARAVKMAPDSAENLAEFGQALKEAGKPDRALSAVRRAVALAPDVPYFNDLLLRLMNASDDEASVPADAVDSAAVEDSRMPVAEAGAGHVTMDEWRVI